MDRLFFFVVLIVACYQKDIIIPLKKISSSFSELQTSKIEISTNSLKSISKKNIVKILNSNFQKEKYYLTMIENTDSSALISLSSNFSGFWGKQKKCYDCCTIDQTPKCSYDCIDKPNFVHLFACKQNCIEKKNFQTPAILKKFIKKAKHYTISIKILLFENEVLEIEYPIVLALETRNIKNFNTDGQIGLRTEINPANKQKNDFISYLSNKKNLEKNSFSIYFNTNDNENFLSSHILLGNFQKTYFLEENLKFIEFEPQNFTVRMEKIQISNGKILEIQEKTAYLDIENYFIGLPNSIYQQIEISLKKLGGTIDYVRDLIFVSIDKEKIMNKKIILFFTKNINFTIYFQNILKCHRLNELSLANYCLLRVKKTNQTILGKPFFENIYSYFDYKQKLVGLGTANNKNIPNLIEENLENDEFELIWQILLIICSIIILILLIIIGLIARRFYIYRNSPDGKHQNISINITENNNDSISLNNESFIGCDSFNLEYEITETKRKTENNNELLSSLDDEKQGNYHNKPNKKQLIDEQHEKIEEHEEKIEKKLIQNEEKMIKINEKKTISKEFDEKNGFNTFSEENEGSSSLNEIEEKQEKTNETNQERYEEENPKENSNNLENQNDKFSYEDINENEKKKGEEEQQTSQENE